MAGLPTCWENLARGRDWYLYDVHIWNLYPPLSVSGPLSTSRLVLSYPHCKRHLQVSIQCAVEKGPYLSSSRRLLKRTGKSPLNFALSLTFRNPRNREVVKRISILMQKKTICHLRCQEHLQFCVLVTCHCCERYFGTKGYVSVDHCQMHQLALSDESSFLRYTTKS